MAQFKLIYHIAPCLVDKYQQHVYGNTVKDLESVSVKSNQNFNVLNNFKQKQILKSRKIIFNVMWMSKLRTCIECQE